MLFLDQLYFECSCGKFRHYQRSSRTLYLSLIQTIAFASASLSNFSLHLMTNSCSVIVSDCVSGFLTQHNTNTIANSITPTTHQSNLIVSLSPNIHQSTNNHCTMITNITNNVNTTNDFSLVNRFFLKDILCLSP